jgi:hypothetical protein
MDIEKLKQAIPDKNSSDEYWKSWHGDIKKTFGQEKANQAFIVAFAYRASNSAKTKNLFQYGKSQGMNLETNLMGDAGRIVEGVKDAVSGITGKIGRIFKAGGIVFVIIIILFAIPIFMLMFNLAQKPDTVAQGFGAGLGGGKIGAAQAVAGSLK